MDTKLDDPGSVLWRHRFLRFAHGGFIGIFSMLLLTFSGICGAKIWFLY